MKYDSNRDLVLFIAATKVKYINNCQTILDFKQMGLFLICQGMWRLGGLRDMIIWESSYWFSTPGKCFVGFLFFVGIERKRFYLVQSIRITYELRRKYWSDYWCVTWVENPYPDPTRSSWISASSEFYGSIVTRAFDKLQPITVFLANFNLTLSQSD